MSKRPTTTMVASATYRKEILYDRETRDYAMYLDGELVGFIPRHRIESRTAVGELTVKDAVESVVEEVLTVEPIFE